MTPREMAELVSLMEFLQSFAPSADLRYDVTVDSDGETMGTIRYSADVSGYVFVTEGFA